MKVTIEIKHSKGQTIKHIYDTEIALHVRLLYSMCANIPNCIAEYESVTITKEGEWTVIP